MNTAHIHLMITHLPIIGAFIGLLILVFAYLKKDANVKTAAYIVFVVCAIGTCIAYATGEGAEELVENLPGVVEAAVETHEDAAMYSLVSMIALGVMSMIGIIQIRWNASKFNFIHSLILVLSLLSMATITYTGNLGGKIRHTEITNASAALPNNEQPSNEFDED
jgi:uncharacterized membrane protein